MGEGLELQESHVLPWTQPEEYWICRIDLKASWAWRHCHKLTSRPVTRSPNSSSMIRSTVSPRTRRNNSALKSKNALKLMGINMREWQEKGENYLCDYHFEWTSTLTFLSHHSVFIMIETECLSSRLKGTISLWARTWWWPYWHDPLVSRFYQLSDVSLSARKDIMVYFEHSPHCTVAYLSTATPLGFKQRSKHMRAERHYNMRCVNLNLILSKWLRGQVQALRTGRSWVALAAPIKSSWTLSRMLPPSFFRFFSSICFSVPWLLLVCSSPYWTLSWLVGISHSSETSLKHVTPSSDTTKSTGR